MTKSVKMTQNDQNASSTKIHSTPFSAFLAGGRAIEFRFGISAKNQRGQKKWTTYVFKLVRYAALICLRRVKKLDKTL